MLRAATLKPEVEHAWVERKIAAPKTDRTPLRFTNDAHLSRGTARRAVDAVVMPPAEAVHQRLHVESVDPIADAGEDDSPLVGFLVAIGVFQKENVRRRADEHATVVTNDRRWPSKVTSIDRRAVVTAVAVLVLEQPHLTKPIVTVLRVADHLDDEQPAVLVERHRYWVGDERLGGSQLDAETGFDGKCSQSIGGFGRFQTGKIPLDGFRFSGGKGQFKQDKPRENKKKTVEHEPNQALKR